eukprot:6183396-Pleurochrysis_carterae.AAC.1
MESIAVCARLSSQRAGTVFLGACRRASFRRAQRAKLNWRWLNNTEASHVNQQHMHMLHMHKFHFAKLLGQSKLQAPCSHRIVGHMELGRVNRCVSNRI